MATLDNNTIPFISDQLDEFFEQFGVSFISTIAVVAVICGVFIAFCGAKGQGPKVLAFITGFLVGAYVGALILEAIDKEYQNISTEIWLGGFVASGIIVGILCVCIVMMMKLVLGIATGLIVAAIFFQIGGADVITNEIALIVVVVILCVASAYLAYKLIDLIYAILASVLGGSFVALGVGSFTDSPITLNLLTSDPEEAVNLCQAAGNDCYIPLGVGAGVTFIALIYNIYGFNQKRKQKDKSKEIKERNDELVAQMREDREGFEEQLVRLEQRNQEVLRTVQLAGTQQQQANPEMDSFRFQMESQQKGIQMLEERLAQQESKDNQNIELINELRLEKQALQEEAEQNRKEHEVELKMAALNAEDPEAERELKAMLSQIQQDASQMRIQVNELERDFVVATKLEKDMNIILPKGLRKRRFNFFESDDEYEQEIQEVYELKQRAEEFQKLKVVISKAKKSQKSLLREIKKSLRQVDGLLQQIRKLSFLNGGDNYEKALKAKKEKDFAITDVTVKMGLVKTLFEKYHESNEVFGQLIGAMEVKLEEFKEAELALETAAIVRRENIEGLFKTASRAAEEGNEESPDIEEGLLSEEEQSKRAEELAMKQAIADGVNDDENNANMEKEQAIEVERPPPPPKVWRDVYFERPARPSNQELNSYFLSFIRHKYPNTIGRLNFFGQKVKQGVVTAGGQIAQKTKEYRESRRSARNVLEGDPEEMEVVRSPQSIRFSPTPTASPISGTFNSDQQQNTPTINSNRNMPPSPLPVQPRLEADPTIVHEW